MENRRVQREEAAELLVRAVLSKLSVDEEPPRIGRMPDNQHWWRYGQETFVGLRPQAWHMPPYVPIVGWLDSFPEMVDVRALYFADPVLGPRVDALLGTITSRAARNFDWLFIQQVIEPMVLITGSYEFVQDVFRKPYARFESGFGADTITMVEFLPLNGLEAALARMELPDGLVLQPMTDGQMDAAISALAVPRVSANNVNGAQVSRFDQWALTSARTVEVVAGTVAVVPSDAEPFPTLAEPAERLIRALHIVCGGSAVTTRPMYAQADNEFPIVVGTRAMLTEFGTADASRPTRLLPDDVSAVCATYLGLGLLAVEQDRSLQVAIRRLVIAGTRNDDVDRLIDLMTAAEALFVKRANLPQGAKASPIAVGASQMLGHDAKLASTPTDLHDFMRELYRARNAEIHGDGMPHTGLRLLTGIPTDSLALAVADGQRVIRRAVELLLLEHIHAAN
jgi:Apea-like HEPN